MRAAAAASGAAAAAAARRDPRAVEADVAASAPAATVNARPSARRRA